MKLLRPPVQLNRPVPATAVPAENAMHGGTQYSVKLDGVRAAAFILPEAVVLQTRAGNDVAPCFPEITPALAALKVGTVVDGEVCAWSGGRLDFTELLRTPATRSSDTAISYVCFDIIAIPAGRAAARDLRALPLTRRWELLADLLRDAEPPVQLILATGSRATAMTWYQQMVPAGVEGIVSKPLAGPYDERWTKTRHSDTVDAAALALLGPPTRPHALLVRLPDGREATTTPRLNPLQAGQVADAAAALLSDDRTGPGPGGPGRSPSR